MRTKKIEIDSNNIDMYFYIGCEPYYISANGIMEFPTEIVDFESGFKTKQPPIELYLKINRPLDEEIKRALIFVRTLKKITRANRDITSYGMKHIAEDYFRKNKIYTAKESDNVYVSNGAFIFAMVQSGFTAYMDNTFRCIPNCYFNVSKKDLSVHIK